MRVAASLLYVCLSAAACDTGPVDSVTDTTLDAALWREDATRIAATLPRTVGTFAASEGASSFSTSYSTGPVFGASCTYADHDRQLTLRIEAGNIRSHDPGNEGPHVGTGKPALQSRDVSVHGAPAVVRFSEVGRESEVTFFVKRRYRVILRLVPASNPDEGVSLAEAVDLGPLASLVLGGVAN